MIPEFPDANNARAELNVTYLILWAVVIIVAILFCIAISIVLLSRPPASFSDDATITIAPGTSVIEITETFKEEGLVRSSNLLYAFLVLEHDTTDIHAGTYVFEEPLGVRALATYITEVGPQEELLTLTIPEGVTVEEIARIADKHLRSFNTSTFLSFAREHEGYLFPDTYHVPETYTHDALFDLMRETYDARIEPLRPAIAAHTLSEEEIVILASIIEREANSSESMRMVSGVLQNRLEIDMALQADASIGYVLEKPLAQLTPEDLEIDSPYNTYLYRGLTPTPIGNPGLESIRAVLEPAETDAFYYITDDNGEFHYAETFEEHKANIARYLR